MQFERIDFMPAKFKVWSYIISAVLVVALLTSAVVGLVLSYSEPENYEEQNALGSFETTLPIIHMTTVGNPLAYKQYTSGTFSLRYKGLEEINTLTDEIEIGSPVAIRPLGGKAFDTWSADEKSNLRIEIQDSLGEDVDIQIAYMPDESDWKLLNLYNDKSLIRTNTIYTLASELRVTAPRMTFCELIFETDVDENLYASDYRGVYAVTETIKQTRGRTDIADFSTGLKGQEFETGGGYILKIDSAGDDPTLFFTSEHGFTFYYDYPKSEMLLDEEKAYIISDIAKIEQSVWGEDYTDADKGYRRYIDVDTLIDFIIINELGKNYDALTKDAYIYRDDGKKLQFGPIGEFTNFVGNTYYSAKNDVHISDVSGFVLMEHPFVKRLCSDEWFSKRLNARWQELRKSFLADEKLEKAVNSSIAAIDEPAIERNFSRWTELYDHVSQDKIVDYYAKEASAVLIFLKSRAAWLDEQFK